MIFLMTALVIGQEAPMDSSVTQGCEFSGVECESEDNIDSFWRGAIRWERRGANGLSSRSSSDRLQPVTVTLAEERLAAQHPEGRSLTELLLQSTIIDSDGVEWRAVEVDQEILRDRAARSEAGAIEELLHNPTLDEGGEDEYDAYERSLPDDTLVTIQPASWTHYPWGSNASGCGVAVWNNESRTAVGASQEMSYAQERAVTIFERRDFGFIQADRAICSGTMVEDDWVLTAAHCLFDTLTLQRLAGDYYVCTYANHPQAGQWAECADIDDAIRYPDWLPGAANASIDWADDAALLELDSSFSVGHMRLSSTVTA